MFRTALTAGLLAAVLATPAAPAFAQAAREFCVARLPFAPVPPATQSKLVVYQAYIVPHVGVNSTEFRLHVQLQNQSSGTIRLRVLTANLNTPPGGRWWSDHQTVPMTSYQPVDVVLAKLTLPGQSNQPPFEPWQAVSILVASCPLDRG